MLPGVYPAKRKDGTPYFRAGIHYKNKHISLGSYTEESLAHNAYSQADSLLHDSGISLETALFSSQFLSFEKIVVLCNFRDNGMYIKTPIYLRRNYFSYYFSKNEEYKFDIDDLFFYSQHKILRRGGRLFVNEYGMQTSIFSRYGIPSHGVPGRDFTFANGDSTDLRYSNVILLTLTMESSAMSKTEWSVLKPVSISMAIISSVLIQHPSKRLLLIIRR